MRHCLPVYLLILMVFQNHSYAQSHHPQEFLNSVRGAKDEGWQIYNHFCVNCHAAKPLISLGAPKFGDPDDWRLRLKQGFSVLFQHTSEGFNAMPSMGGCFECSDEQLALALIEMAPKEARKGLIFDLRDHKKHKE